MNNSLINAVSFVPGEPVEPSLLHLNVGGTQSEPRPVFVRLRSRICALVFVRLIGSWQGGGLNSQASVGFHKVVASWH
jgi:hypothetical protein